MKTRKTLPFFLASASSQRLTGILNVTWGGKFKSFIIEKGRICDLLSNAADESIEEFLKVNYNVPEDLLRKAAEEGKSPVEFLVERGILSLREVKEGNEKRIAGALEDILSWEGAEFSFQEWEVNCELPPVDIAKALKKAIFSTGDRMFFKRLFPLEAKLITSGRPPEALREEVMILKEFSRGARVWDVVRESSLGEFKTLKIIAYLYIFGFLKPYVEEVLEEIDEVGETSKFTGEESSFGVRVLLISLIVTVILAAGIFAYIKIYGDSGENRPSSPPSVVSQEKAKAQETVKSREVSKTGEEPSNRETRGEKIAEVRMPLQRPWKFVSPGKLILAARMWRQWALKQKGYTLLVQLNCVEEYAIRNLRRGGKKYFAVPVNYRGKTCFRICYGVFSDRKQALRAKKDNWVAYPLAGL